MTNFKTVANDVINVLDSLNQDGCEYTQIGQLLIIDAKDEFTNCLIADELGRIGHQVHMLSGRTCVSNVAE